MTKITYGQNPAMDLIRKLGWTRNETLYRCGISNRTYTTVFLHGLRPSRADVREKICLVLGVTEKDLWP